MNFENRQYEGLLNACNIICEINCLLTTEKAVYLLVSFRGSIKKQSDVHGDHLGSTLQCSLRKLDCVFWHRQNIEVDISLGCILDI